MAEIITRNQHGKRKQFNTRVDLTPMVDLGFLLITFFVFTTTLSTNKALNLIMPKDDKVGTPVPSSGAFTIIPADKKLYFYEGAFSPDKANVSAIFYKDIEQLRSRLIMLRRKLIQLNGNDDKLVVMIKPATSASFSNVVDIIDEMTICQIKRYAMIDIEPREEGLIKEIMHE